MQMNMRRNHFIQVWQSAPTLKAAAEALGMKVRSVTRQANRLRAEGLSLKSLTDQRFNRHTRKREKKPLTSCEQMFMEAHYQFARRMSWRACRSIELPPQLVEDSWYQTGGVAAREGPNGPSRKAGHSVGKPGTARTG